MIKLSFVKGNLRVTFWQKSVKMVQKIMRENKFTEKFQNPLTTKLLARGKYDQTTEEEKKAIAKSFNLMHQEEVQLIMRYQVAKLEMHSQDDVGQALIELTTFIQDVKCTKIEEKIEG